MAYQFTAAAERALAAAADWTFASTNRVDLDDATETTRPASSEATGLETSDSATEEVLAPALLLGLLAEEESRAAVMLAANQLAVADVLDRWPELRQVVQPVSNYKVAWSLEVEASVHEAIERLADHPRPLVLGTEHLLLGLLAANHDTARWLAERGVAVDTIAAEIDRLHGIDSGPIEIDWEPTIPLPVPVDKVAPPENRFEPAERAPAELRQLPTGNRLETTELAVLRILDASANRAREGLRVVEDFTRFVLDDRHLTEQLKTARHDLTAALAEFGSGPLLVARDTVGDVGTTISTDSENRRDDPASVATASFKRVQEALRSLEEYGKLIAPAAAARLEQLRYRLYTLERVVMTTVHNVARLSEARLYVLMDGRESLEAFRALVTSLVEAGVDVLQLRDKQLSDRDLLARAEALRSLTAGTRTRFVMNDRADLARLSGADGVHVGQDELTVAAVRRIVGPEMIVGVSTHSLEQARQAVLDGADYLGVGPVFPSTTKTFPIFPGTELLRSVAAEISLPAFAIGGITLENLPTVLASGIRRVAISGAIINSTVPGESARRFRAALETV